MRQHLILLKGHPATGKSTIGRALAGSLGCPLIDKDDVKDFTVDLPGGNELAYAIVWRLADTQLSLGLSVVVDTPLSYPQSYASGQSLAGRHDVALLVIETCLDESTWRQRLERRSRPEAAAHAGHRTSSWAEMQALLERYAGCWRYPIDASHHLPLDAGLPLDRLLGQIHSRLEVEP